MNIKDWFVFDKKHLKRNVIIGLVFIAIWLVIDASEPQKTASQSVPQKDTDVVKMDIEEIKQIHEENKNKEVKPKEKKKNPHLITKETFKGQWAFTTDSAEIYCTDLGNDMLGYKVIINNREYSIANMKHLPYLPSNLWKNVPMKDGLCLNGAYSDGKCKVYLDDTLEYAKKFCKK